jgi:NAD(P)-dependent dehydrogenase (short-subunit alcohol dehydrogenase family)
MEARLNGRVALVTGGSQGIGLATGLRFAESGADVVLLARRREILEEAAALVRQNARGRVSIVACDVMDPQSVEAAYDEVMAEFGRIDIVVNNAGTASLGPFVSLTDSDWQKDLELKLFGAIRLTRLAWPQMVQRRWGRVINVLAGVAKVPRGGSAPTSVSRAAGMALTKVLAGEGAPDNILVNSIHVGFIESGQWRARYEREAPAMSYEEFIAEAGKAIPLGRLGTSQEVANVACFLASDLASYVTGTAINVDGNSTPVM